MIPAFLVAFGSVFLADLPDKTMVASLVLTTKPPRRFAVSSFASDTVKLAVAGMFFVGGVLLLRGNRDEATAPGLCSTSRCR